MTGRRFFSKKERTELFSSTGGRCAECDQLLKPSWHGGHKKPYSRGGKTELINGQPECPKCNLRKGARMEYYDTFKPRPAQDAVIEAVLQNVQNDVRQTVALLAPGSGKELLGQAVSCHLYRLGLIEHSLALVPRIQLAKQCETNWRTSRPGVRYPRRRVVADWAGNFELFDSSGRIEFFEHMSNNTPLIAETARAQGIVSTYQSLVSKPKGEEAFRNFWETWRGRFLLVVDEAQFCGDDEGGGGTLAGEMVKKLHEHAAHTLIMTGTAERSDGARIVCCNYGEEPNAKGVHPLRYDVLATYQDGIREGYLRKFVAAVSDSNVPRRDLISDVETVTPLSEDGSDLTQVLRKPSVWQPIADETVAWLRDKRRRNVAYQGLISCMEKSDAQKVYAYLKRAYPDLRIVIAVSEQDDADQVLRDFKKDGADILVTVRMAFIGYDCKTITVVGILTNYRDKGHLMQLVGRGLRVSDHESFDDQSCICIAPDDPRMQDFITELKRASEQGVKARKEPGGCGGGGGGEKSDSLIVVGEVSQIGVRSESADGELGHGEYQEVMKSARQFGLTGDPHNIAAFLASFRTNGDAEEGALFDVPSAPEPKETPKTAQERINELCRMTSSVIKSCIARDYGISPQESGYQDLLSKLTANVNGEARGNAAAARRDEELAFRRFDSARRMYGAAAQAS